MRYCKKTSKLFFNKYVNKVAVRLPVAGYFRGKDLKVTKTQLAVLADKFAGNTAGSLQTGGRWNRTVVTLDDVFIASKLSDVLATLSDYMLRVEGNTLGIYCNDDDFLAKVTSIKGIYVEETSVPADDKIKEFLLTTPKAIIRKEYTHKYKVTINPLWDDAEKFKEWASKLPKIKTTNNKYQFGGYFYVADEKTLSLCHIFLSDRVRKVEKLVTNAEI